MKTLCFGAVLWDIIESKEYIGGALFNLAAHLRILGNESYLVSAVGTDVLGRRALREMERIEIDPKYVSQSREYPTGTVDVTTDAHGQPQYEIHEGVAYDSITLSQSDIEEISGDRFDVVCFGTLEQRAAATKTSLRLLLEAVASTRDSSGHSSLLFCDLNLRQEYYTREIVSTAMNACDILKINNEELGVVRNMFFRSSDSCSGRELMSTICESFGLEALVVTRGQEGCAVYGGETYVELPGEKVVVVDTVGAGDAFSAAFLSEYLATGNIARSAQRANTLGAYVASRRGAVPQQEEI